MGTLDTTLFQFGIYPNQSAYQAITVAVGLVHKQHHILQHLTTQLYPAVGNKCNCSWSTAERRIRLAAEKAWNTNPTLINSLAQRPLAQPPTASDFIWILCRHTSEKA